MSVELVSAAAVRALVCPYCRRPMPLDEAGMFAAQARWGFAGAVASRDGRPVGVLLVSANADPEAAAAQVAMISAGWVDPAFTGRGIGRQLVQTLAAGLLRQQAGSMIAAAARTPGCAAFPRRWLAAVGFVPTSNRGLWRLDLGQTVTTRFSLRSLVGRWLDVVRPVAPPEPAGRAKVS